MTEAQASAIFLLVLGVSMVSIFLANYNLSGNAVLPGRLTKPVAYWGNIIFFGGFGLFGAYGLLIGF